MSASTEKKTRQAAREAGTDKKQLAAEAEAKKKAASKRKWTIGTIAVVLAIALIIFLGSDFLFTSTTALTIGGEKYSPAEVNYSYANQYFSFANQYGSYASIFGLDTSGGVLGLDSQACPMLENGTWRDYFLDGALQELCQTKALCDYAEANGISLTDEEIAQVDESVSGMEEYAVSLGYSGADAFFKANYGRGVTYEIAREAVLRGQLANKTSQQVSDSFVYTPEELEEYYQSLEGGSDLFDYAYYLVNAEDVESVNEEGETVSEPTEETIAAAKELAQSILDSYQELVDSDSAKFPDHGALLDDAVAQHVPDGAATHPASAAGSSLGVYKDFLMGQRAAGDAELIENSDSTGFYVVVFLAREDNHYHMANVRHILVMAEASDDGTYSDEAKEAAKARAEEILAEWQAGDATEDSFAELANEYSADGGSNTNGGLYENVQKGQMVEEFDAFCFGGHQPGDTAIVYGESASYAGYHVMYYVGEGDLCSDYIARNDLLSEDMSQWMAELTEGYEAQRHFTLRYVG